MSHQTCGDAGGITKAGNPCRVFANLDDDGRCLMHSESRRAEMLAHQSAAGTAAAEKLSQSAQIPRQPKTLAQASKFAAKLAVLSANGGVPFKLAAVSIKALDTFTRIESRRLEKRLRAAEKIIKAMQKDQSR